MSALQAARAPVRGRLSRISRTTLLFTVVAPLIGALMLFVETVAIGYSNSRDFSSLSRWPDLFRQSMIVGLQIGAPYAFLTGVVFGLLAEFARARQLWWALGVALLPLTFAHWLLPVLGDPIWAWGTLWLTHVVIYIAVPTTVCWMIWRRWLGRAS